MNTEPMAIEIRGLTRRYGRAEAVNGLNLRVRRGSCYGLFGRNGAGKTTTIKCLLNLLRPTTGEVRVFGMDPQKSEVSVKSRLAYVPDQVAFYPWMSIGETLRYLASFRPKWNCLMQEQLLRQFELSEDTKVTALSKGQRTQLALLGAVCAEPELLILDEPTSGLDPVVRREFIRTVIGAYQDADPGNRTILVSTHLISEFEGLIDEFTVVERGKEVMALSADEARARYKKIRARFAAGTPSFDLPGCRVLNRSGREVEFIVNGESDIMLERLRAFSPEALSIEGLTLEEIFIAAVGLKRSDVCA